MSVPSSVPLSSAITLNVRDDIREVIEGIFDKILYVDGFSTGDEFNGVFNYVLRCDADYNITLPLFNFFTFKIGPDLIYVEITYERDLNCVPGSEDADGLDIPGEGFTAYVKVEVLKLQISRKILVPVHLNSQGGYDVSTDPNEKVEFPLSFIFRVNGNLEFSVIPPGADYTFSIPPCQIGNTPIILTVQDAKLDLSRTSNIPEATAAGYANDFVGIYVQEAFVGFPQFWNHDSTNSTALIRGRNLIIGTGGFSGSLSLESAQTNGAALFKLGNPNNTGKHFQLGLTQFLMEFKQNSIVKSEIRGYMKIPGLKDGTGDDANSDVLVYIGNNGDFRVTVSEVDGLRVTSTENIFQIKLRSVSLDCHESKIFCKNFSSSADDKITNSVNGKNDSIIKKSRITKN